MRCLREGRGKSIKRQGKGQNGSFSEHVSPCLLDYPIIRIYGTKY